MRWLQNWELSERRFWRRPNKMNNNWWRAWGNSVIHTTMDISGTKIYIGRNLVRMLDPCHWYLYKWLFLHTIHIVWNYIIINANILHSYVAKSHAIVWMCERYELYLYMWLYKAFLVHLFNYNIQLKLSY